MCMLILKKNSRQDPGVLSGGQLFFDDAHVESLKKLKVRSWFVIWGGQSSFDLVHVESLKKL